MRNEIQLVHRPQDVVLAKEKKAATQLGVIVGAFILCWMPYFTLFMVVAYYGEVNNALFTTAIWFGYFNSALNPILYPLCNANFKRAFKRMLGFSSGGAGGKAVGSLNSDRQRVTTAATGHHSMFTAAVAATSANRLRPPQSGQQQQGISPRHSSGASFDLQSCVSGNGGGGGGGVRTQLRSFRS